MLGAVAILLPARIPATVLPNRTGGIINGGGALKMARSIAEHGWGASNALTPEQAKTQLVELHGAENYQGASLADFKLQRLRENAFF